MSRRSTAFTLVEIMVAFLVAAAVITGLIQTFGNTLQQYVSREDTLTDLNEAQILLTHLEADVGMLMGDPAPDLSVPAGTGTTYPKHVMHLTHRADSDRLVVYDYKMNGAPAPLPADHPLAPAPGSPLPRSLVAKLAWIHNTMAWVGEPADATQPSWLVLNVLDGTVIQRVTYRYDAKAGEVVRQDRGRQVRIGRGAVREFWAVPYAEILLPEPGRPGPPQLLRTWLEVHLVMEAPGSAGARIDKRRVDLQTRMVPRHFVARVHGQWGL